MLQQARTLLNETIKQDGSVMVLTGAGISEDSGIPTFRGKEGFWTVGSRHYHPQEMATAAAFKRMPRDVWSWYLYRRTICKNSLPNAAHLSLKKLEKWLKDRFLLVTQNVDGIHLRVGHQASRVFQIHGNLHFARCWEGCHNRVLPLSEALPEVSKKSAILGTDVFEKLKCPQCGGWLRPHVLWFDECYDEDNYHFDSTLRAADQVDLLIVVGTSGSTNLPSQVMQSALRRRARVVVVDAHQMPFPELLLGSEQVTFLKGKVSLALPRLLS